MADRATQWSQRIGRRLKLRDLHILIAVAQSGSMAKAASELAISPPAISKAISDLEHTLGVKLLDRTARGAEPTVYGHAVLRRGAIAFDELKQAVRDIEFLANPYVGEVRIACAELIAAAVMPPVIESLYRRHPDIVPIIDEFAGPRADFPDLRSRNVDLVVARLFAPMAQGRSLADFHVEILFNDYMIVAASAKSPWARRRKIELGELADEPWILAADNTWNTLIIAEAFRALGLGLPRISARTISVHVRTNLLDSGRFITVLPRSVMDIYGARLGLKTLPIALPKRPVPVAVVTLKARTPSPVVGLFIDELRAVSKSLAK